MDFRKLYLNGLSPQLTLKKPTKLRQVTLKSRLEHPTLSSSPSQISPPHKPHYSPAKSHRAARPTYRPRSSILRQRVHLNPTQPLTQKRLFRPQTPRGGPNAPAQTASTGRSCRRTFGTMTRLLMLAPLRRMNPDPMRLSLNPRAAPPLNPQYLNNPYPSKRSRGSLQMIPDLR